jgi:hypothetical protein
MLGSNPRLSLTLIFCSQCYFCGVAHRVFAAPADIPEETLQVSIVESARSQVSGRIQNSSEQALEQQQLRVKPENVPARLAPKIQQAVVLLRIRKLIKSVIPFFPFF